MEWQPLLMSCLLAASGGSQEPEPKRPEVEPIYTRTRAFKIPFLCLDAKEQERIQEVQLFVSRNGDAWQMYTTAAPDAGRFIFRADEDGDYSFAVRTVDKMGAANPQDDRDLHVELRVIICAKPPPILVFLPVLDASVHANPLGMPFVVNPPVMSDSRMVSLARPTEETTEKRKPRRPKRTRTNPLAHELREKEEGARLPDRLHELLYWLPADTETLMVAQGPVTLGPTDQKGSVPSYRQFQELTLGLLKLASNKKSVRQLHGLKVVLALEGSRRFGFPSSLGPMPYEGCLIILFETDSGPAVDKVMESFERAAAEKMELTGRQVSVFKRTQEQDVWTILVTRPKPNTLLLATDRGYLQEVLERMTNKAETRALPEDLPEWKYVDAGAPMWAVRHFHQRQNRGKLDVHDSKAIGLAFYHPAKGRMAKVTYLSASPKALKKAKHLWRNPSDGLIPFIRQLNPGIIEVVADLEQEEGACIFEFILLAALGHGIAL